MAAIVTGTSSRRSLSAGIRLALQSNPGGDVFAGIGFETINEQAAPPAWLCYPAQMGSAIWIGVFVGSTIGGMIPELWGGDMISYSGVLLSGVGAFVGLWLGSRVSR
jgi:predicted MFS family arabinose efflux permease